MIRTNTKKDSPTLCEQRWRVAVEPEYLLPPVKIISDPRFDQRKDRFELSTNQIAGSTIGCEMSRRESESF
jgi:hypothetical protein